MKFSSRYVAVCLLSIGMSNVAVAGLDAACMAMKVGGQHYTRMTGSKNWSKAALDISAEERKMAAEIKSGKIKLSKCKAEASEKIDGVAMQVLSYTVEMAGAPAASAKLYIGKSDGLPYAQTGNSVKTRFRYTGITAPKP